MQTHAHTHIHAHVHTHIHTLAHTHTHSHTHTHTHTHIHTHTHADTHTRTHTHTHTHTHAHTPQCLERHRVASLSRLHKIRSYSQKSSTQIGILGKRDTALEKPCTGKFFRTLEALIRKSLFQKNPILIGLFCIRDLIFQRAYESFYSVERRHLKVRSLFISSHTNPVFIVLFVKINLIF